MSNFIYRPANAVETCYRGCRFRSRLEARWAVFFDHLGPHPMVSGEWIDPRPGDWGWLGLGRDGCTDELHAGNYGFGLFRARRRLWYWEDRPLDEPWLQPEFDPDHEDTQAAYTAANSARFEHGEKGWLR